MLYYGIAFDIEAADLWDDLESFDVLTGYSVGAFTPNMAMIAATVGGSWDDLFNPTLLEDYIHSANKMGGVAAAKFKKEWDEIPKDLQERILKHAVSKEPNFLLAVMDDD